MTFGRTKDSPSVFSAISAVKSFFFF